PLSPGAVLRIVADDPAARVDVPHFCREQGHELVELREGAGAALLFWVRKGGR
ncbi:MAG: sulfurtransferase TusA family protein, partial [Thermohalobaculum sp.]|nr:sulfurtransferase TusA family protein [Thermohalobaculum sp.]